MYADRMTKSMEEAINETNRRRSIQIEYNTKHGITPVTISKSTEQIMEQTSVANAKGGVRNYDISSDIASSVAADPVLPYLSVPELEKIKTKTKSDMDKAAKDLDFMLAARYRDELFAIEQLIKSKY